VSLSTYMQLPVEQYFVLDADSIKPIADERFSLQVPQITLFDLGVAPLVEVKVTTRENGVELVAGQCKLNGSPRVERLDLDTRFCMSWVTDLKWEAGGAGGMGSIYADARLDVWCEQVPPFNLMPRPVLEGTCNAVLSATSSLLLPVFLRRLAADYQKWATDANYRESRAARSRPLELPM